MKQTAVEWLVERLKDNGISFMGDEYKLINQAKEMDKEQKIEAWEDGAESEYQHHVNCEPRKDSEEYYNKTYITPQEKAKELVGGFPMNGLILKYGDAPKQYKEHLKQCALIAVDEMIKELENNGIGTDYWYEVKQEIEKL